MKHSSRRFVALLLTFLMLMTSLPTNVFADTLSEPPTVEEVLEELYPADEPADDNDETPADEPAPDAGDNSAPADDGEPQEELPINNEEEPSGEEPAADGEEPAADGEEPAADEDEPSGDEEPILGLSPLPSGTDGLFGSTGPDANGNIYKDDGTLDLDAMIEEYADSLYAEGNGQIALLIRQGQSACPASITKAAGESATFNVYFAYEPSATWATGYPSGVQTLYDTYRDGAITITLPEGLLLSSVAEPYTKSGPVTNADGSHTWTVPLNDIDAASSAQFNFDCVVYICGNGTDTAINEYDLSNAVNFTTHFDVVNKATGTPHLVKSYTQTLTASPFDIETESPDVWKVVKNTTSAVADRNTMTLTAVYTIEIGLDDGADGVIKTAATYNRVGRDAIESMSFEDALSTLLTGNSLVQSADLQKVTVQKVGGDSAEFTDMTFTVEPVPAQPESGLEPVTDPNAPDLSLNTVKVDSDGNGSLDQEVGAYTKYNVTAVYTMTEDMIQHFVDPDDTITLGNKVDLSTKLADLPEQTDSDSVDPVVDLPVRKPAKFNIVKNLRDYNENTAAYDNRYGLLTYTIKRSDGQNFSLYVKNADDSYAVADTDSSFVVNTGAEYIVDAGAEYVLFENLNTDELLNMYQVEDECVNTTITPNENQTWTTTFLNEELAGAITITKQDDGTTPAAVSGAEFTLTKPDGTTETATTGDNGVAVFKGLSYGTYSIDETVVPAGYAKLTEMPMTATLDEQHEDITLLVQNHRNFSSVTLTKYRDDYKAQFGNTVLPNKGTFVLQRTTDGTTWEDVTTNYRTGAALSSTTNASGSITDIVAAFASDGTAYTYRFKETIANGYYDPADPDATEMYSEEFTLVDTNGKALPSVSVKMYNRQRVKITVNKQFWSPDAEAADPDKTTKLYLYSYDGSAMTQVGDGQVGASVTWENLPLYDADGDKIEYYVGEDDVQGWLLDTAKSDGTALVVGGKTYMSIDAAAGAETTRTLYNIEQTIPVTIYKKNYYTKAFVKGTGVTVTEGGETAKDFRSHQEIKETAIPDANGLIIYLEPGKTYNLTESVNTSSLTQVNATDTDPIVIDLTGVTAVTYDNMDDVAEDYTYTVYNKPDPRIRINKQDSVSNSTAVTKNAVFSLFTLNATTGKYEPYPDAASQYTVNGSNTWTTYRLPAGTYYAAETTVPAGYLDPNSDAFASMYTGNTALGTWVVGETADGTKYTFATLTVADASRTETSKTDNQVSFTLKNIPNTGKIEVRKYLNGAALPDSTLSIGSNVTFTVDIYNGDTLVKSGVVDLTTGKALIEGLPVYDADGNKITYTVKENDSMGDSRYYKTFDGQTAELALNTTTATDTAGAELKVMNSTDIEITAGKKYIHTWEYNKNGKEYEGERTEISVYQYDETTDTWKYLDTKIADNLGQVRFTGLEREGKYAVIENSFPKSPYEYPVSGGYDGSRKAFAPKSDIADADMSNYAVLKVNGSEIAKDETEKNAGTLYNRDSFVQFHITKWIDADPYATHGDDTAIDFDRDAKYDNAIYILYRYEVPEGETNVTFAPADWEKMGVYSSGTAYHVNAQGEVERSEGEFFTDVDQKVSDNVVYMLVESSAGSGDGKINPNFQYTFYQRQNGNYTVTLPSGTARMKRYLVNDTTYDDLLNSRNVGPGGSTAFSYIRLTKWWDDFDEDGNELASLGNDYKPLVNVEFGIYLDSSCNNLLQKMTVGLDGTESGYSMAQSIAYRLKFNQGEDATIARTGLLVSEADVNNVDPDTGRIIAQEIPVDLVRVQTTADYTLLAVEVYVKELSAPEGYAINKTPMKMYMGFACYNGTNVSTTYSDGFFTKDPDPDAYPLARDSQGMWSNDFAKYCHWTTTSGESGSYQSASNAQRIIDLPMTYNMVTVRKFGYTPTTDTLNKGGDELDQMDIDRTPLAGVVMSIEKYDEENNQWKPWSFMGVEFAEREVTFTTRANGAYTFAKGLPAGQYRIVEKSGVSSDYEVTYKNTANARVFTVPETPEGEDPESMVVSMYNPTKPSLTITKKGTDDQLLGNVKFTLTAKDSTAVTKTATTATSGDNKGKATFTNIASGTYTLSEGTAPSGYDAGYFSKYMATLGTNLEKSAGVYIGYKYTVDTENNGDQDVVISTLGLNDAEYELEVINPKAGRFAFSKVDETTGAPLSGATFTIYRKLFNSWSGAQSISPYSAGDTSWSNLGTTTSGSDGVAYFPTSKSSSYRPGVYAIVEATAPAGYDIIKDASGNPQVYYVIITGGLNVTFPNLPAAFTVVDPDIDATQLKIPNREQGGVVIGKVIESNDIDATSLTWSVQMDLYAAASGGSALKTVNLTSAAPSAQITGLSQGTTYYLQETVTSNPASNYTLQTVTVNGTEVTAVGNRYPITISDASSLSIQVTNRYNRGRVIFRKEDLDDHTWLSGATFKVCAADGVTAISGATVTESVNAAGDPVYVADIPLTETAQTFTIVETAAPEGYVCMEGTSITVSGLTIETNVLDLSESADPDEYMTNPKGFAFSVQKYSSKHGELQVPATTNDAYFTLYHLDTVEGKWEVANVLNVPQEDIGTDENGQVSWLLIPGEIYAFNETDFNETKFVRLDGVYQMTESGESMSALTLADVTIDGNTYPAYIVPQLTGPVAFSVYNVSKSHIEIIKRDVGGYPANVVPLANYAIYELENELPTDKAQAAADVEALLASDAEPVTHGTTARVGTTYTSNAMWNDVDPTKSYVIVETGVTSTDTAGKPYNTLNKDDARVNWFVVVPAGTEQTKFYLDNVYSDAAVTLSKTVETAVGLTADEAADSGNAVVGNASSAKVASLLKGSRNVLYTLQPKVTLAKDVTRKTNQPLSKFVLSDTGITAAPADAVLDYKINTVEIGAATHNVDNMAYTINDPTINAKVTWYDADGEQIGNVTTVNDLSMSRTVTAPSGAKSFDIEYYSAGVESATAGRYTLGAEFEAEATTVAVTVLQTVDGTVDDPITEVTKFTNEANVTLEYPKWSPNGELEEDPVTKTADDDQDVSVLGLELPTIEVSKTSNPSNEVQVGKKIVYTITVKNKSTTEKWENPVVVDMLPAGFNYLGNLEVSPTSTGETVAVSATRVTGKMTAGAGAFTIDDQETGVVFDCVGVLDPAASFTISFECQVTDTAILYGENATNYVTLSSSKSTYHTVSNPHGYNYKDYEGTLPTVSHNFGAEAEQREGALHDALGDYATDDFVWVKNKSQVKVIMNSSITCSKAIRGDKDGLGFSSADNFLATATRDNGLNQGGSVDYRLTVYNGETGDYATKHYLVVGDVLPEMTDCIGSSWSVIMKYIASVNFAGDMVSEGADYHVYYYTGTSSQACHKNSLGKDEGALIDALQTCNNWTDGTAWPQLSTLPANWHNAADVSEDDMENVTAFLIIFEPLLELKSGESITLQYHTITPYMSDEEFAEYGFTYANNRFQASYFGAINPLVSNTVKAVLMGERVAVAGDVWIDEDWDATQQTTGNRRDYGDWDIISKLLDSLTFAIKDNRKIPTATGSDKGEEGEVAIDTHTDTDPGESIKRFYFDDLGVGQPRDGYDSDSLKYTQASDGSYSLNIDALKTTDPYNYIITALLGDSSLAEIFKLTAKGANAYKSDDPDAQTGTSTSSLDSNFSGTTTSFTTDPFYLDYSDKTDQSKDIGFMMYRDLLLTKTAADDSSFKIEGAKFSVYGPFDEDMAATASGSALKFTAVTDPADDDVVLSYKLDPNGTVTELVTNADGQILITDLNWWKEYVIKETAAGAGFDLEGAAASGDDDALTTIEEGTNDNEWILKLPDYEKIDKTEKMDVTNVRSVTFAPEAYKALDLPEGVEKAIAKDQFTFELKQGDNQIETKSNAAPGTDGKAKVTFSEQTFNAPGTYTYTIKEVVPADEDKELGYTYSTETITVTVMVAWDEDEQELVATAVYKNGSETVDPAVITNSYIPPKKDITIPIEKIITGADLPKDKDGKTINKTFEFTLAAVTDGAPMPETAVLTITGEGEAEFGPISYEGIGEYDYTITETDGGETGYEYDTTAREIHVKTYFGTTELVVEWTCDDETVDSVEFENVYTPEPVTLELPVKKTVTGPVPEGEDETFEFVIVAGKDSDPMPTENTVTITGSGTNTFGEIEFTEAGVYTYTVSETDDGVTGYTYDDTVYTVTATVVDDDGELTVTWVQDQDNDDSDMEFTNPYLPEPTTVDLPVYKVVEGPVLGAQKFTFTVEAKTSGAPMPESATAEITTATTGDTMFGTITYTAAGEYVYEVTEANGGISGYTYSEKVYTVTVTVTDEGGELGAEVSIVDEEDAAAQTMTFTNTYAPGECSVTLPVTKAIDGPAPEGQEKEFTFTLTGANNAPMPESDTLTIEGADTANFGKITYSAAGTYTYTLKEEDVTYTGYGHDETVYTITVTVVDNNGTLEANWTAVAGTESADALIFTNPYEPGDTTVTLPVKKTVTGTATREATFTFTLTGESTTAVSETIPMPAQGGDEVQITIDGTGSDTADFGEITFTEAGTYTYTVVEDASNPIPGYDYDDTEYTVTIEVVDNDGELEATWKANGQTVDNLAFTNPYGVDAKDLVLPVTKVVEGPVPTINGVKADKTFEFVLKAETTGAPMSAGGNTLEITGSDTASFGKITYSDEGTYEYTLTETPGSDDGYEYSDMVYTITVVVEDIGGELKVTWETNGDSLTFTNTYTPADTTVTLPVKKTVTGPAPKDATFTFTLTCESTTAVSETIPMPAQGGDEVTITVGADESDTADFGEITFTEAGTYTYTVAEDATNPIAGYDYDDTVYTVTIEVVDTDGELEATWKANGQTVDNLAFTNPYGVEAKDLVLPVTKVVEGPVPTIEGVKADKTFKFELTAVTADAPMPEGGNTLEIKGSDTANFGKISYPAVGEFVYTLTETPGSDDGYEYSEEEYTITVTVEDIGGELKVTWSAINADDAKAEKLSFTNTYTPAPTTVTLPVKKTVEGPVPEGTDKTFEFVIEAADSSYPMPDEDAITITGSGESAFDEIEFTEAGTYTYTVTETPGSEPGYTYSTTTYTVVVTVVDTDGALEASWIANEDDKIEKLAFTNVYGVDPVTMILPVEKAFTDNGYTRPVKKDFTFTLTAGDDKYPMPEGDGDTVVITDEGSDAFGEIEFTEVGTYTYTVTESDDGETGYTYDDTVYTVSVEVSDVGGSLQIDTVITGGDEDIIWSSADDDDDDNTVDDNMVFTNTYEPEPVAIVLDAKKTIQYVIPEIEKEFTFTLAGDDDTYPMPAAGGETVTVEGTADKSRASFGEIEFTEPGTYSYTVTEEEGAPEDYIGYTFDASEHTVEIVVGDEDGTLKIAKVTIDGTEVDLTADEPEFLVIITNNYAPVPVDVILPVEKQFTDNGHVIPVAKDFEFVLEPYEEDEENPNPMPADNGDTVTVTGADEGVFGMIEFTEIGKWQYKVTETDKSTELPNYTFDNTEYIVTVEVEDVDGTLVANVTITGGDEDITWSSDEDGDDDKTVDDNMVFTNEYKPTPVDVELEVAKTTIGDIRPDDWKQDYRFTITPVDEDNDPLPAEGQTEVTVKDYGTVKFNKITLSAEGTYQYVITEEDDGATGFTYDDAIHTMKIVVTDNDGKLEAEVTIDNEKVADKTPLLVAVDTSFENEYHPIPVDVNLPARKQIIGKPTPTDKEFTFTLTEKSMTAPDEKEAQPMPADGGDSLTVTGAAEGEFGTITFSHAGTYIYEVKEENTGENKYDYDAATHYYTVVVTDVKGELKATWGVDGTGEKTAEFTNVYAPDAITLQIPVAKQLTGHVTPNDKDFHFVIAAVNDEPMPATGKNEVVILGEGTSAFDAIVFDYAGDYEYTVTETPGDYTGYTYDGTTYTVEVNVVDNDGNFEVAYKIKENGQMVFVNTYQPIPVDVVFPVTKIIDGTTPEGNDKDFVFDLTAVTEGAPMPEESSVTVTGEGEAEFPAITFGAIGTYKYELVEEDGGEVGYTYDTAVRKLTVVVTDNDGTLEAEWTVDGEEVESAEFTNVYVPIPTEATFEARKILRNMTITKKMFVFRLYDEEGNMIDEKRNDDDGNVTFETIPFTEAGVYTFSMSERPGYHKRIEYDDTVITITVTVTDNDGVLEADVAYSEEPVFTNIYTPEIPKTGYGPSHDQLLYAAGALALLTLLGAILKKDKKRKAE